MSSISLKFIAAVAYLFLLLFIIPTWAMMGGSFLFLVGFPGQGTRSFPGASWAVISLVLWDGQRGPLWPDSQLACFLIEGSLQTLK